MINLWELFFVFLKIGTFGFGGPFALLALMRNEVVEKRSWLTADEFVQSTAIGTLTPGPIFFSAAVYVGVRLRGIWGAMITAIASLLPAFLVTIILAMVYLKVQSLLAIKGATHGIASALIGLLVIIAFRIGKSVINDWVGFLIALISFISLVIFHFNPVGVILGAALVGMAIYRPEGLRANKEK
ncbi:MAG TPA: chromate transporter [Bacillota bacterium]|nr:chromate transporter [Bacillota bacterium]